MMVGCRAAPLVAGTQSERRKDEQGMRTRALMWTVLGIMLVVGPDSVRGQEATPAGEAGTVACMVEPRPIDELLTVWYGTDDTLEAAPPEDTPTITEAELPTGHPADEATVEAVDAVVREWIACSDLFQLARMTTLMTDEAVRAFGPREGDTRDQMQALLEEQTAATPEAGQTGVTVLEAPRDVRVLDDGRVGGIWAVEGEAAFIILEQQGDRWLLDELFAVVPGGTPVAGTPTA